MSIQAVAWALEQDLPARPKLVLVSLANHANHTDGYCWLKVETIAAEAACSHRAVYNFVGDLIRNGFIRKALRKGADGKQRANDYWILFHREAAPWVSARDAHDADPEGEDLGPADEDAGAGAPQNVVEPHAPGASGESDVPSPPDPVDMHVCASGPHAHTCIPSESLEPSKTKPKSPAREGFGAPPRRYQAPPPPQPVVQGATGDPAEGVFVFKGTRAWDAWMQHRRRTRGIASAPTTLRTIDGRRREGWFFPTLFPPDATGPPKESDLTDDDVKALTGE